MDAGGGLAAEGRIAVANGYCCTPQRPVGHQPCWTAAKGTTVAGSLVAVGSMAAADGIVVVGGFVAGDRLGAVGGLVAVVRRYCTRKRNPELHPTAH
jgi:hypothetical protein